MSFSYGLDTFQADASVLDPWASRSACEPFKSRISIQALAPVILWDISPGVFHSQMFSPVQGLISPVQVSRVTVPDTRCKPLAPPACRSRCPRRGFWRVCVSAGAYLHLAFVVQEGLFVWS